MKLMAISFVYRHNERYLVAPMACRYTACLVRKILIPYMSWYVLQEWRNYIYRKAGIGVKTRNFVEISTFYYRLDQFSENVNGGGILCLRLVQTCLLDALMYPKSKYGIC